MYTLGINAAFHDSSAALVRDGRVVAAAEEERFTRIKHAKRPVPFAAWELPFHAIDYCLGAAGIGLHQLDHVAYAFDPRQLTHLAPEGTVTLPLEPSASAPRPGACGPWEPLLLSYVVNAPRQLRDGVPHHLRGRWEARSRFRFQWHFVEHHLAHEASAFLPSPFQEAAVLTLDGRGERVTTSHALGTGRRITRIGAVEMPHSLGLFYEEVTRHLGFLHASDEYKVMAMAGFGRPLHLAALREALHLDGRGRFRLEPLRLAERFGPARGAGEALEQRHFDLACSAQALLEEAVFALADWLHGTTGQEALCMAGGVALNCLLNGRLLRRGPFRRIWVQPAAGDAGTALGAALWVDAERREEGRLWAMEDARLGPAFPDEEIEELLRETGIAFRRLPDPAEGGAALLAEGKVIGWFQGAMEFGPRALGGRSILASPRDPALPARLNRIKGREEFRPVAPAVLEEEAGGWFEGLERSPFMLFVHPLREERRAEVPAVAHVDGTARVQTVSAARDPLFHALIAAFARRTGIPMVVNTSFNTGGEPIVRTPRDALETFFASPLDALVIGPFLLEKRGAP